MCQSSLHVIIKCQRGALGDPRAMHNGSFSSPAVCAPLTHSLTRFERLGGWMDIGVGFNLSSRTPVASERIVLCDRARNFCAIHRKSRSVQQLKFDTARVDPQKPLLRRANGPKWPPTRRPFPHTPTRSASACCVQSLFLTCCCCCEFPECESPAAALCRQRSHQPPPNEFANPPQTSRYAS